MPSSLNGRRPNQRLRYGDIRISCWLSSSWIMYDHLDNCNWGYTPSIKLYKGLFFFLSRVNSFSKTSFIESLQWPRCKNQHGLHWSPRSRVQCTCMRVCMHVQSTLFQASYEALLSETAVKEVAKVRNNPVNSIDKSVMRQLNGLWYACSINQLTISAL